MLPGATLADRLAQAREEISEQNIRLGGAAGLARNDDERRSEFHGGFGGEDLRGIGRVENAQMREAGLRPKDFGQHLRSQARPAHAEQQRIGEARLPHILCERLIFAELLGRLLEDRQPANPLVFISARPQ